jgi:hypothetical protein
MNMASNQVKTTALVFSMICLIVLNVMILVNAKVYDYLYAAIEIVTPQQLLENSKHVEQKTMSQTLYQRGLRIKELNHERLSLMEQNIQLLEAKAKTD